MAWRSWLVVGLAAVLLLGMPARATAAPADAGSNDPTAALGATSPSCRYALDVRTRQSCRVSGSATQPHPLTSYGLDVRVGFSVTDPGRTMLGALQTIAAASWMTLLYVVRAVLLLLEWSFSLDLTSEAMPDVRERLQRLHEQAFGEPWLLLAISIAGLWGIWRGLVQRRATETLGGLGSTVALMVAALVIISRPDQTVGEGARMANGAGLAILAAGTGQPVTRPRQALTLALSGVFTSAVRDPWCALEFGSVAYCDQPTGDATHPTVGELWLSYPAQSWQRGRLHDLTQERKTSAVDPLAGVKWLLGAGRQRHLPDAVERLVTKAPAHVRLQEDGGTFSRLALLVLVTIGLLGAVALFAHIGLRLLLAAGLALVLLLIAPAMLLAPALGDSGRATFVAWGKRLLGAILAKLVYSVFLVVVLAAGTTFARLEIGWFGTWLVLASFWWGIFLKRNDLVEFVSAGAPHSEGGLRHALAGGYSAWMVGRGLQRVAAASAAPVTRGATAVRSSRAEGRLARTAAIGELAREHVDAEGRRTLHAQQADARHVVVKQGLVQRELRAVDRRLHGYDEAVATAHATHRDTPTPTDEQRQLLQHRDQLRLLLDDPIARAASESVRHAERNRALTGDPVSARDLEARRTRLASAYRNGDAALPERGDGQRDAVREGDLLAVLGERGGRFPSPSELDRAASWLPSDELRRRTAERRAAARREGRLRRATGTGRRP